MKLTVIGSGYVGLVAGACFAEIGNHVTCVDSNVEKIKNLQTGIIPIHEPGLDHLIINAQNRGWLKFSTSLTESIEDCEIIFIAVGTPMGEDGSADLQYVLSVAKNIGQILNHNVLIVTKSTVPVGTAELIQKTIQSELDHRGVSIHFSMVSNPEFLKEGAAITDFTKPDRIIIGCDNPDAIEKMKLLYQPFCLSHERFIVMDVRSAELTKYAANAMLATKISFMNEMANLCELLGADVNKIRIGIGSDSRIGYQFIYPGCGYGGSCFPKDVKALQFMAQANNYHPRLIQAVDLVNDAQKHLLVTKICHRFTPHFTYDRHDKSDLQTRPLAGFKFAIWGLAFKPGTDDMREAPSLTIIKELTRLGAQINAYDPIAIAQAKFYLVNDNINYIHDPYEVLLNADALLILTEWKEFRMPDFQTMHQMLKQPIIFDGRNIYQTTMVASHEFEYHPIGKRTLQT